jgi:hypothetical protein
LLSQQRAPSIGPPPLALGRLGQSDALRGAVDGKIAYFFRLLDRRTLMTPGIGGEGSENT